MASQHDGLGPVASGYRRNVISRDTRYALSGIRALGLTRPGQVAAGLPGDFALQA